MACEEKVGKSWTTNNFNWIRFTAEARMRMFESMVSQLKQLGLPPSERGIWSENGWFSPRRKDES